MLFSKTYRYAIELDLYKKQLYLQKAIYEKIYTIFLSTMCEYNISQRISIIPDTATHQ